MHNQPVSSHPAAPEITVQSYIIAESGERLANYLIDLILFYVVYFGVNVLIGLFAVANGKQITTPEDTLDKLLNYVFLYLIYMIYYCFVEGASNGRSLGKLITRTKVVKKDNAPITWEDAFTRSLCRIIPFEPFSGFLGTPWHDEISKTKVVKLSSR